MNESNAPAPDALQVAGPRRVRAVAIIAVGVVALAGSAWHVLAPPAPSKVATSKTIVSRTPLPTPTAKRPYGDTHMDGLDFPAPEMRAPERAFLHQLIVSGLFVLRVVPSGWDTRFSQADADVVTTDQGDLTVIAPYDPNHPVFVCPRGVAMLRGIEVPTYELSAGGTRIIVQIAGHVSFGRVGDLLVLSQDAEVWHRVSGLFSSVACPPALQ